MLSLFLCLMILAPNMKFSLQDEDVFYGLVIQPRILQVTANLIAMDQGIPVEDMIPHKDAREIKQRKAFTMLDTCRSDNRHQDGEFNDWLEPFIGAKKSIKIEKIVFYQPKKDSLPNPQKSYHLTEDDLELISPKYAAFFEKEFKKVESGILCDSEIKAALEIRARSGNTEFQIIDQFILAESGEERECLDVRTVILVNSGGH